MMTPPSVSIHRDGGELFLASRPLAYSIIFLDMITIHGVFDQQNSNSKIVQNVLISLESRVVNSCDQLCQMKIWMQPCLSEVRFLSGVDTAGVLYTLFFGGS